MESPPSRSALPVSGCESCDSALSAMFTADREVALVARFQPVADLAAGGIYGHLSEVHGSPDGLFCAHRRLFAIARRLDRDEEMFRHYCRVVFQRFVQSQGRGVLFLPLGGVASALGAACVDILCAAAEKAGLPLDRLVVVHDGVGGHEGVAYDRAVEVARELAKRQIAIAAGALHCPRSEALLWQSLRPQFAFIEEGVLGGLDPNLLRVSRYAEEVARVSATGVRVVARDVNTLSQLKVLQELAVACAAGDFIGRPSAIPTHTLSAAAHKAIAEKVTGQRGQRDAEIHVLERLLQTIPPVTAETTSEEVFSIFEKNRDLRAIAVVRGETPIGLISRYDMVDNMARSYRHELYGRKSCTRFMDAEPLVVDVRMHLGDLSEVLVNAHPRHLISGFIICDEGRYIGIGSVQDLMREVTAMQMEAAKYANPLTQLPGNVPINQTIDNLLAAREPCAIAYCDLDHFKPFNDVYGYARGDDVIRLTARVLTEVCDPECDFVGHIGGDDFVLIFRSADWKARCERALRTFGEEVLGFFSRDDIERGGYVTENRKGEMEFHALTSLSIGVVEVRPGAFRSHLEVSVVAAEVKKKAKAMKGNSLWVNQRSY